MEQLMVWAVCLYILINNLGITEGAKRLGFIFIQVNCKPQNIYWQDNCICPTYHILSSYICLISSAIFLYIRLYYRRPIENISKALVILWTCWRKSRLIKIIQKALIKVSDSLCADVCDENSFVVSHIVLWCLFIFVCCDKLVYIMITRQIYNIITSVEIHFRRFVRHLISF